MDLEHKQGSVEVICGSMFAGKTEELIRRITRLKYAKKELLVFRPVIDNRYSDTEIVSHSNFKVKADIVASTEEASVIIENYKGQLYAICFDEVQFFDRDIIELSESLAKQGYRVILAGLDTDFRGEPFGFMGELIAKAQFVDKLHAICTKCGAVATRTQRLINGLPAKYNDPIVLVGATESYEARCIHCHEIESD